MWPTPATLPRVPSSGTVIPHVTRFTKFQGHNDQIELALNARTELAGTLQAGSNPVDCECQHGANPHNSGRVG